MTWPTETMASQFPKQTRNCRRSPTDPGRNAWARSTDLVCNNRTLLSSDSITYGLAISACDDLLYDFKAARWAGASAALRQTFTADMGSDSWLGLLPLRHCPGRAEPVKGAFGVGFAADP